MECNKLSNSLTEWAQRRPLKSKNQKDLLLWMAAHADPDNTAYAPSVDAIKATTDIGTKKQLDLAIKGLMDAGHITSRYDMAKYKHIYTLNPR